MSDIKYLVPWSGGVDSTMALIDCLKSVPPGNVRAISFDVSQINKGQRDNEKIARERIKGLLDDKYGYRFANDTIKINTGKHGPGFIGHCPQPVLWVSLVAACIQEDETVAFGWLKTDYDPKMVSNLLEAWKNLTLVNGGESEPYLPWIERSKAWVQQSAHDHEVLKDCWYCENPVTPLNFVGKPCMKCECCLSFKAGEMERKMRWPKKKLKVPKRKK